MRHNLPQTPSEGSQPLSTALIAHDFGAKFPTPELVQIAAAQFTEKPVWSGVEGTRRFWVESEAESKRFYLRIAPGALQVLRQDVAAAERSFARAQRQKETDAELARTAPELFEDGEPASKREIITEWSRKSRANMIRTLAQLDYMPMFETGGIPAMVTLTLPGDWLVVAPDAKTYQNLVLKFRKRWEREWGKMHAVWKREFQRRGAPHTHFFVNVPTRLAKDGRQFREWLSETWADIVNHPDEEQRRRHLLAGTGVDYNEGMRASDPQRLAVYFAKHGSANAGGVKEYQNQTPEDWEGQSVGRFWGIYHLQKVTSTVNLEWEEWIQISRIMRRHHRAKGLTQKREVWRVENLDYETGEAKLRKRKVTRRSTRNFVQGSGFVTANDAPAFAQKIAAHLDRQAGRSKPDFSPRHAPWMPDLPSKQLVAF